ncbi:MAG: FG-GAP repeat protein, partial [Anaerolineae bacterium]
RFGIAVAISGDTAVVGADGEDGGGDDMGAAYVLERNQDGADSWGQVKKLFGWDSTNYDWFGISVAISGDTVVVGAYGKDGTGNMSGAAYVFERNKGQSADYWGQIAKLTASDAGDGDRFGYSVAISDDTIVVGAPWEQGSAGYDRGSAYLFTRNEGGADNWGQAKKLLASDEQNYAYFGYSVAISGDTVVVGAYRDGASDSERGAAYVFERNEGGTAENWGEVTKLTASDSASDERFGNAVAISGDTIVIGAYWEDGWMSDDRGAAYVFERNDGGADNWGEVKKLLASDTWAGDEFGQSVAISGDTIVVGAHLEDGADYERGAAYVYERNVGGGDNWGQVAKLTASDAENNDNFGNSVSISGDTVVVGAYLEDGGSLLNRGAAYVFNLLPYRIYLPLVSSNN